eukprot:NODE_17023_length_965_cov_3.368735.p1 GENE.NODE_17023_length_965_cov_3.368735~~NODE_17023_length_965_cov_3.368735.p1  ORF type:complete len:286 (+),score=56.36 NODE_17023_length_965_cov_3.368735:84-860(+)
MARTVGLLDLPSEILAQVAVQFFDCAQPVARLANAARAVAVDLSDGSGHLLIGAISTPSLETAADGLERASLAHLESVRVDYSSVRGRAQHTCTALNDGIARLSRSLMAARSLRVLCLRLTSFDAALERLRIGHEASEALLAGLLELGRHGQLSALELSFMAFAKMKNGGGLLPGRACGSVFAASVAMLPSLEELRLTHNHIIEPALCFFLPALSELPRLRLLDLSRNNLSKVAFRHTSETLPHVTLLGADTQAHFCQ